MARIVFPVQFLDEPALFTDVMAKHTADGAASPLIPFLNEQNIDLVADQNAVNTALDRHHLFLQNGKDAEKLSEERDKLFKTVFNDHRSCVQFLKKLYKTNIKRLGDWGVTVNGRNRIHYAPDFLRRHEAVINFIDKHDTYAAGTSPLQPFLDENEIDLAVNRAHADDALTNHVNYIHANDDKENFREQRDLAITPVRSHLRGIGNFLVGLYIKIPHRAGDWGYTIDASPKRSRERTVILKEGQHKTVYGVLVGSKLKNKGATQVIIYPGKVRITDNAPILASTITLNPGEVTIVKRKFGILTVKNTSLTAKGAIFNEIFT